MPPRAALRIYEDELRVIVAEVLRFPETETGGGLYGLWTHADSAVVMLACRPGPRAERRTTRFVQDPETHMRLERKLWERHGVQCVGLWHSHHRLGLPVLSNGDVDRTRRYARHTRRELFVEILSYYLEDGRVGLRPYLYRRASEGHCVATEIQVLPGVSPLRQALDRRRYRKMGDALAPAPRAPLSTDWVLERSNPSVALPSEDGGVVTMPSSTVTLVGAVEELIGEVMPADLLPHLTLLAPREGHVILQVAGGRAQKGLRLLFGWEEGLVVRRWEVLTDTREPRVLEAEAPNALARARVRPLLRHLVGRITTYPQRSDDGLGVPPAVSAGGRESDPS